jgi:hypothetical protein
MGDGKRQQGMGIEGYGRVEENGRRGDFVP